MPSFRQALAHLILWLTAAVAAAAEPEGPPAAGTAEAARVAARQELDAMHAILLDGHPGAIDAQNPGYRARIESGYQAALARVKDVQNQHDAMSVADSYAASFHDAHLTRGNGVNAGDNNVFNGWIATRSAEGQILVTGVAPDWPVALPPIGAEVTACDGQSLEALIAKDVEPFMPVLASAQREMLALLKLSNPAMSSLQLQSCVFRLHGGEVKNLAQHYQHMDRAASGAMMMAAAARFRPVSHVNVMERLADGTLWIRAGNFMLNAQEEVQLQSLLAEIEKAQPARRIVFDVRGNTGGVSSVGWRIFQSATGGLVFDDEAGLDALPRTRAWWRISPTTVQALDIRIADIAKRLGADSPTMQRVVEFQDAMRAALARGEHWIPQDDGEPLLTPAELVRRKARLARFSGPIVLLTDSGCVSACLDFADLVRTVPGSLHVGETTSFDSVYIDTGALKLPSGNTLTFPLKVWRNRLRGNDEPWVPQVPIAVTGRDDAQVRAAVLAAAEKAGR